MAQSVITIIATAGAVDANSYLTLAEMETIIHQRPHHDSWDALVGSSADDIKKAALIWATRILDTLNWKGIRASETQALRWPREGVYYYDDLLLDETSIPEHLKVATSELAFNLNADDRLSDSGTEGFKSIQVGSIKLDIDKLDRKILIPKYIMNGISELLNGSNTSLNAAISSV